MIGFIKYMYHIQIQRSLKECIITRTPDGIHGQYLMVKIYNQITTCGASPLKLNIDKFTEIKLLFVIVI